MQSLGVGSRAVAMGDAFSALADDASATFWNPGRLSVIQTRQFMLEARSVPNTFSMDVSGLSTANTPSRAFSSSTGQGLLSFAGAVLPLEKRSHRYEPLAGGDQSGQKPGSGQAGQRPGGHPPDTDYIDTTSYGHLGFSYALGGYLNALSTSAERDPASNLLVDSQSSAQAAGSQKVFVDPQGHLVQLNPQTLKYDFVKYVQVPGQGLMATALAPGDAPQKGQPNIQQINRLIVRNQFYTLAYGNRTAVRYSARRLAQFGYGVGLVYVNQGFSFSNINIPSTVGNNTFNASGTGFGYIVGLSYGFGPDDHTVRFGLTYRSPVHLDFGGKVSIDANGFVTDPNARAKGFGDEIPGRLSFGTSYETRFNRDDLRITGEVQYFSEANEGKTNANVFFQQDRRVSVANFHFGMEYVRNTRQGLSFPVRLGFRTNKGAAVNYTFDTDIVSLGLGVQGRDSKNNQLFNIEPSAEIITGTGATFWTLTGLFRF